MDIIEKICSKYKIEYTLLPDRGIRPIRLTFGPGISRQMQLDVEDALARLSIFPEDSGMDAELLEVPGRTDALDLKIGGKPYFRLTNSTCRVSMSQTPLSETAAWAIAIAATHPDWLGPYAGRGYHLVCGCFSARQQSAALRLKQSVEAQYSSSISPEDVDGVFQKLKKLVSPYVHQAPRFSARPISQESFRQFPKTPLEGSLGQIAQRLYGDQDFAEILQDYCLMIQCSSEYQRSLEEAVDCAMDRVYDLPITAIPYFFSGLRTCADEFHCSSDTELRHLKQNKASFPLSPEELARGFRDLDKAYASVAAGGLLTDFLYQVCEKCEHRVHQEYGDCRRELMRISSAMRRFCYIRSGCFEKQSEQDSILSWKSLSHLQERDIFSRDVSWGKESFGTLMNEIISAQGPVLYLCPRNLASQMVDPAIHGVPVLDSQLVWVFWVDQEEEEVGV